MRTFAWRVPPLAVVHHVGRTSGRSYRTPVVPFRSAQGFVIPMTYGRDVDWARNLVAAHGGEVEQSGQRVALRNPRIVTFGAAEARLPGPRCAPSSAPWTFPAMSCWIAAAMRAREPARKS